MKFSTRDLCFCAIGAALIAVCAWISIPADVPFTLQTFAIFAVCGLLGGKRGTVSVLVKRSYFSGFHYLFHKIC